MMNSGHPGCRQRVWGRILATAVGTTVVVSVLAPQGQAQIIHGRKPQVSQGLTYMSWEFSGDVNQTLAQWFIPVSVNAPIAENLEVAVSTGANRSEADWKGSGDDISGLVDSRIQVAASLLEDQVVVSAGVSLPTGKTGLTPIQQELLGFMASDVLNFPIKNPGEGLNLFGEIGFAVPVGSWVFGAAGAFFAAGEYSPYELDTKYKPGSRVITTFGIERSWPEGHFVASDIVVVVSADDELDGEPVFRDGTQIDLRLTDRLVAGRASLDFSLRYIIRGKDHRLSNAESVSDLVRETHNRNGNDLRLRLSPRISLGPDLAAWLSFEAKMLAANEYAEDDPLFEDEARIQGLGGGVDFRLSHRTTARVGFRSWSGSSDGSAEMGKFDLTGFEILQRVTITL
jgi:hypothetical protein